MEDLMKRIWVLEWSFIQQAFHVEKLTQAIETNYGMFMRNGRQDFIPVAATDSEENIRILARDFQRWRKVHSEYWNMRISGKDNVPKKMTVDEVAELLNEFIEKSKKGEQSNAE